MCVYLCMYKRKQISIIKCYRNKQSERSFIHSLDLKSYCSSSSGNVSKSCLIQKQAGYFFNLDFGKSLWPSEQQLMLQPPGLGHRLSVVCSLDWWIVEPIIVTMASGWYRSTGSCSLFLEPNDTQKTNKQTVKNSDYHVHIWTYNSLVLSPGKTM